MSTALWSKPTDDEFIEIVQSCNSMAEIMRKLGYKASTGRSREPVKARILNLGLEVPVPDGNMLTEKARAACRIPDEEYFVNGKERKGQDIRKRLLQSYKENKCEICGMDAMWNGHPLILQVDHINGDHYDNRLDNLRLVCPNCHSQTDTYCGKNIKKED